MDIIKTHGFMGQMTPSATLAITSKAKAMKAAGEDVCSLCAGEPDFDTPDHIKNAAIEALNKGMTKYTPATGCIEFKNVIADKFRTENAIQTTAEQIVISPGAKFSVFATVAALCGPGDNAVITAPYWLSYPEMIKSTGAEVRVLNASAENNYELNPEELENIVDKNTKLLILNTPSNPTGAIYSKQTLEKISEIAIRNNFIVLADEIYEKLTYDADKPHISIASLSSEINARTVTVNGMSKAYSMTGWRIGYLTAPLWLTKKIAALQSHTTSNPTTFAQYGGIAAITGTQEPVEQMRNAFAKRRDLIFSLFSSMDKVSCIRPSGAFYLFCDISETGDDSLEFCSKLLEQEKTAVIPGTPFGASTSIRLSYACADSVIKEAAARIERFIEKNYS
jgi:aspartate aminotransferase